MIIVPFRSCVVLTANRTLLLAQTTSPQHQYDPYNAVLEIFLDMLPVRVVRPAQQRRAPPLTNLKVLKASKKPVKFPWYIYVVGELNGARSS